MRTAPPAVNHRSVAASIIISLNGKIYLIITIIRLIITLENLV